MSLSMEPSHNGRRSVDTEINMVPMIDLLVCCITFLVLTAVWSTMSRLPASAMAPGTDCAGCVLDKQETLHVQMRGDAPFQLAWKLGDATLRTLDVPRKATVLGEGRQAQVTFPELSQVIRRETAHAEKQVTAVLHTDNAVHFREMAGVMDALMSGKRTVGTQEVAAVSVTLARD